MASLAFLRTWRNSPLFWILFVCSAPFWLPFLLWFIQLGIQNTVNAWHTIPLHDTLSLQGRTMLMQVPADTEGNRLALVTFDEDNTQTRIIIPGSGGITGGYYPSTAIMPDNTVVWADVSDKENYRLFKWSPTTNSTSLVTSIPLFDLAQYSKDYQSGTAEPLSLQQNKTGYVYADSLIVMNTTTVAFLDAMVTKGDGKLLTEAAVRVNRVDVNSGGIERVREQVSKGLETDFYARNFDAKYVYFNFAQPSNQVHQYFFRVFQFENGISGGVSSENISRVSRFQRYLFFPNDKGVVYSDSKIISYVGHTPLAQDQIATSYGTLECSLELSESCKLRFSGEPGALLLSASGTAWIKVFEHVASQVGVCDYNGFFPVAFLCSTYYTNKLVVQDEQGKRTLLRYDVVAPAFNPRRLSIQTLSEDKQLVIVGMHGSAITLQSRGNFASPSGIVAVDIATGKHAYIAELSGGTRGEWTPESTDVWVLNVK